MTKVMFIMVGCPGSGKSTLAKELGRTYNATICSADDFHMVNGEYKWKPENVSKAHAACRTKAHEAISNGDNVIIDNTNTSLNEVKPYIDMAIDNDYEFYYTEPTTSWRYDVDELVIRNTHNVPRASIEKMLNRIVKFKESW